MPAMLRESTLQSRETGGKSWYLVYTKPRREKQAKENLVRQGYEVYLPLICNRRRSRGRYASVIEPMFPRYLFIELDQGGDNWSPIRSTYGVSGLVYFGHHPARVAAKLVADLKALADEDGLYQLPASKFKPGDSIRIVDGVMAGYEGIYQASTARERVAVLLECAGKFTKLDIPIHQLEPVR